jgi:hypothetical protein
MYVYCGKGGGDQKECIVSDMYGVCPHNFRKRSILNTVVVRDIFIS